MLLWGAAAVVMTALGMDDPAQPWLEQVRQEQIASLYRNLLLGMSATWLAGGALCWLLVQQQAIGVATVTIWFGLVTLLTLSRLVLACFYARTPNAKQDWRKWGAWFTAGATSSGLVWGIGSIFLMAPDRFDLQLLVIVLISAVVYGALAAFAHWAPAFFGFFLPAMIPSALWSLAQGDPAHIVYGLLASIWIPAIAWLALRFYASAVQALSLGFENAALAQDLRRQKALADTANTEKSRFLAAASHDLRQPVHALGLFVGALKNEKLDAGAARLVEHIDVATGSLDELFTALLDVSRLDAGVVRPQLRAFALRPMLERLIEEMQPAAAAKSLSLRMRARDVWVMSDAVMLERIVRNLLSNAVRYTERGGVLAGVRRAGASASIEIWDTGPGIREEQRAMVFREFYQADARGGAGGLGLGLAIVQRLCALLAHPLELKSQPGRGSMFRVRAALASADAAQLETVPTAEPALAAGAHIWVIDDDLGPRAGMQALLTAWGYEVIAAASGEEMLAHYEAGRRAPSAILCDYRLDGEDGVAVIARLRKRVGAHIPAALITGDTGPERLREAVASGLPILHKPVSKPRLRALVGNLARAGMAAD